jgi:hypothetical protein
MLGLSAMWIAIPAMIAAAILPAGWPQPQAEAERQLEAGIHREIVLGDLPGAMEQYRGLLGHTAGAKWVEARALFQIAQCEEKLGRHTDALALYRRVTEQYAGADGATRAQTRLADLVDNSPGPRNLDFEEGEVGKVPAGWQVYALPREAADLAQLRRTGCHSHTGCAVVLVPSNAPPFGYMGQSFNAAPYRGLTVRLSAWLRLEPRPPGDLFTSWLRMEAPAAEDSAQMRLSVDRENHRSGFFDNMENRPVRSADWTRCEIVGTIDNDARFIEIAVTSIGRGRAWVDDVSFDVMK